MKDMGPMSSLTLLKKFGIKVNVPENPKDNDHTKALFEQCAKAMKLTMQKKKSVLVNVTTFMTMFYDFKEQLETKIDAMTPSGLKGFIYTYDLQPVKNLPENKQLLKNVIMKHFHDNCNDLLNTLEQGEVANFDNCKVGSIRMAFGSIESIRSRACTAIGTSWNSTQKIFYRMGLNSFARFCHPMMPNMPLDPQSQLNVDNQKIFHLSSIDRLFLLMDENQRVKEHIFIFLQRHSVYERGLYLKFDTMTKEELQAMVKTVTDCPKPQDYSEDQCKIAILDHFDQHCYQLMGDGFEQKRIGKIDFTFFNKPTIPEDDDTSTEITNADHVRHVLDNVDEITMKIAATILDVDIDPTTATSDQLIDAIVAKSSVDQDSFKTFMETIESLDISHRNMETEENNDEMGKCDF